MPDSLSVLVVDDDESSREYLGALLDALGFAVEDANGGAAALQRLSRQPAPDVVVLDVIMPELDGVETLRRYRAGGGKAPVVMCSALDEADTVVKAMRAGATDYVTKPFNVEELREILMRAVGDRPRAAVNAEPLARPTGTTNLGISPSMRAVDELIDRIADADVPVLITGESGVGKDVVAREIHARSARAPRVFVKINCAALPGELLESELFGHERGSFTGAQKTKPGQFELADGGTLFLDEIGEMPVSMQAKLLQALQDGEFYRVGGQKKIKVDTRVIVATNVDLAKAMERGTFREDLYYRLNVVEVAIPPLRERREDIPRLLEHFVGKYGKRYGREMAALPSEIVERFLTYDFPGNIRELENLVRRLIVLRDPRYVLSELKERGLEPLPASSSQPIALGAAHAPPYAQSAGSNSGSNAPFGQPQPFSQPSPFGQPHAHGQPQPQFAHGQPQPQFAHGQPHAPASPAAPGQPFAPAAVAPGQPFATAHAHGAHTQPLPIPQAAPFGSYAYASPFNTPSPLPPPTIPPPPAYRGAQAIAEAAGAQVAAEAAEDDYRIDLKDLGKKAAHAAEREAIIIMLGHTGGNKREAAERLGISYKAILYKIREFGVGRPRPARKVVKTAEAAANVVAPPPETWVAGEGDDEGESIEAAE